MKYLFLLSLIWKPFYTAFREHKYIGENHQAMIGTYSLDHLIAVHFKAHWQRFVYYKYYKEAQQLTYKRPVHAKTL